MSFPSFVPRLNLSDLRLNDPPVGAVVVPRRNRNGRTLAIGRLCCNADGAGWRKALMKNFADAYQNERRDKESLTAIYCSWCIIFLALHCYRCIATIF